MDKLSKTPLLSSILKIVVSITFSIVFWTFLLIHTVFIFILRFIVQCSLNVIYGRGVYTLANGIDAVFADDRTIRGSSVTTLTLTTGKGRMELDELKRKFQTFFEGSNAKMYRDQLTKRFIDSKFGFACWKHVSSVDINDHVKYLEELNPNPNQLITEDKLKDLMSDLMEKGDFEDDGRPQWELLYIPNYIPQDSNESHFVIIMRDHHAYGDGGSLGFVSDGFFSDAPWKMAIDPLKDPKGTNIFNRSFTKFYAMLFGPLPFLKTLLTAISDESSWMIKNGYQGRKLTTWTNPIDMNFLKELRAKSGVSLTSIILTAITGSIRKYQENNSHKKRFERPIPISLNVGNMSIMLPYPDRQLQNHFTAFAIPIPLKEQKALIRLKDTDRISRNISMSSTEPIFNFFIMRYSGYLPKFVHNALSNLAGYPLLFSNVPGPMDPYTLMGNEMTELMGFLPLVKTFSLGIAAFSYSGKMRFTVSSVSDIFESKGELNKFVEDIEKELEALGTSFGITSIKSIGIIRRGNKNVPRKRNGYPTA